MCHTDDDVLQVSIAEIAMDKRVDDFKRNRHLGRYASQISYPLKTSSHGLLRDWTDTFHQALCECGMDLKQYGMTFPYLT
ncbi:hypothetical protein TNCV_1651651 [Trichonephila clavipes]|nr:hypothetical protein TNCV_1651651 [Trichonephila clavipes]